MPSLFKQLAVTVADCAFFYLAFFRFANLADAKACLVTKVNIYMKVSVMLEEEEEFVSDLVEQGVPTAEVMVSSRERL